MTLVQAPVLDDRQPAPIHFFLRDPQRADGPGQQRRVCEVEVKTFALQQPAGAACFVDAFFGQVDIDPSGKAVFQVPGAFTVAHQYQFFHGVRGWGR